MGIESANPGFRVLVVDDEVNQRSALASMIKSWGYQTEAAADGAEALQKMPDFDPTVIVTDLMMPGMDGKELLRRLQASGGAPPAIVLTAFGNIETAISVVHDLGAYWFLEKPLQPSALRALLERAAAQRQLEERSEILQRQLSQSGVLGELIGGSAAMQGAFSLIRQAAPTSATILITGESGTGKELAARAIHGLSPRRSGPFVAVNCAALPESLMESELFGHEKGAFTGAVERRVGCFELAKNGTLLLDEIGDMPLTTQAKVLRVLEDKRVRRLGSQREIEVDVRVLASTNHDLEEAIRTGSFRADLFFRLNVIRIALPPLRQRREDLPALCSALIANLNAKHQCRVTDLAPAAEEALRRHAWPGNVRELRNVLERAVILAGEGALQPAHLPGSLLPEKEQAAPAAEQGTETVTLRAGASLDQAERELIRLTLRSTGNNRTRAAAILGITPKTLFNKLREYDAE